MIVHKPIQWWADKIRNNEYFSLARFGDGEFNCMEGRKGRNSNGCDYTPELREDLLRCAKAPIYKGMQRITPDQFARVRHMIEGEWYDTEVFADELAVGGMKPFFDEIRKLPITVIGSADKRFVNGYLDYKAFVEIRPSNAHAEKDRIVRSVLIRPKPGVYLFACGMAAGPIIAELHGKVPNAFLIDIGHILDPFCGNRSREYLKDVPEEVLLSNLP